QFPEALRVFIQGWDSFLTLPKWERWQDLFRFSHLCAVSRPGSHLPTADSDDRSERTIARVLSERRVSSPGSLAAGQAGRILILDGVDCDVSSTRLRSLLYRARQGDPEAERAAREYLPAPVAAYISAHRLY
ncbi:MAG: nicotinate-nicotinamide nucleotide adenylyltransferase, partial [Pseudomonadota bacterium]